MSESPNLAPVAANRTGTASADGFDLRPASSASEIESIRRLFLEYAQSLSFDLCFQSFEQELAGLPGDYAPPHGRLLLLIRGDDHAGCVALHKMDEDTCEMKRLYVRPQFRGLGLGKMLTEKIIADAREIGYKWLRLDTVESNMRIAVAMYRSMGFREITPYRPNPIESALYMELEL